LPREQVRVTDPVQFAPVSLTTYERETLQIISDPDNPPDIDDMLRDPVGSKQSDSDGANASPDPSPQETELLLKQLTATIEELDAQIVAKHDELDNLEAQLAEQTTQILDNAKSEAAAFEETSKEQLFADAKATAEQELAAANQELIAERQRSLLLVENALRDLAAAKSGVLATAEDEIVDFCFEVITQIFGGEFARVPASAHKSSGDEPMQGFNRAHEALLRNALRKLGADEAAALPVSDIFEWNGLTIDASLQTQLRKLKEELSSPSSRQSDVPPQDALLPNEPSSADLPQSEPLQNNS
jgi:flagellar biosynthesis/type III secretory pathway protein FliH